MVSASEVAQVEVIYGPFSAEYSGNAMGGVVQIETAIPQEREVHFDTAYFNQEFDDYGFDDRVDGYKSFFSYGDKIGNASLYFSFNHLDNTSQPQTFRDVSFASSSNPDSAQGAILENNSQSRARYWYGDTGVVETTTDNLKFKFGYDFGNWKSLLNIAYEDRNSENVGQSYIQDLSGNTLWSGSNLVQDSQQFSFDSGRINASELNRQSFSAGLRVKGDIGKQTRMEINLNQFDILKDETRESILNPNDPSHTPAGEIDDYDDSGWKTAEIKFITDDFILHGLEAISGIRYENYELNRNIFESPNYQSGVKGNYSNRSGGETTISAAFLQTNWQISNKWDASLGLRFESFESHNGYYDEDNLSTPELDLVYIPSKSKDTLSPKFSLGYRASSDWLLRYSLAKAFRFPIVEELFTRHEKFNSVAQSNPNLEPEEGLHHNIMIEKPLSEGYVRVNLFQESIKQAITSQTEFSSGIRSFVPIDQVDVQGVEFIVNQNNIIDNLDLRFNVTWTDAEIVDNSTAEGASTESIEGNVYPRMPKWRSHLLATYHLNNRWDLSANLQYASDSYGRIDNTDTEDNVYGAQDGFTRIGVKTGYQIDKQWHLSFGIDNVTNEIAYVAHPWPGRTGYLTLSFEM